jgi:hypothetical protein
MKRFIVTLLATLTIVYSSVIALADSNAVLRHSISGYIKDAANGEELIGATILIKELGVGTVTNTYGFYSISIIPGDYTLVYSFVGFTPVEKKVTLKQNITLSIELKEQTTLLEEVVISSEKPNANITRAEMSVARLDIKTIQRMPAFMGEVDVIKSIQLLPGVQSTSEGTSGFSVRGGAMDHNLILLDEATVYNASHLMGFFSVFNNDAIKDVKLYKGDIPASSGGRLASLLDVRMKDGNSKEFVATGGIGTISSRLTLEGPIMSENTSFIVSGRRTYADVFLPFAPNKSIRDNRLYFYDMNIKLSHRLNNENRLFFSGYFGRDIFKNDFAQFGFGNQTLTFRWNHLFSPKLFLNTSAIFSSYDYYLGAESGEATSFIWKSEMQDYSVKFDFNYFLNSQNNLKFGIQSTYHYISPGRAKGLGDNSIIGQIFMPDNYSLEHGIYAQNEQNIAKKLTIKYGIRLSAIQNMGKAKVYSFNDDYEEEGFTEYKRGEIFNMYSNLEPRLGMVYAFNDKNSVKTSYSRTVQYIQQASNSSAGTPLDIWFPASPNVKPQLSNQWAVGYFKNLMDNSIETSFELYYKTVKNVIDFKEFANILLNDKLEGELRIGRAKAYGFETMVNYNRGKLNGWISYTYSRVFITMPEINNGNSYPAFYDKPHDISIVMNYELNPKVSISGNWVYSTGVPATFPAGRYEILGVIIPLYTNRNSYRYPDYHRLDLAITYRPNVNSSKKWQGEWNLSIYNAYNRKNAWAINFVNDEDNPNLTYAEKTYLFSILPALTYNFKF